jgi:hypothetical protein
MALSQKIRNAVISASSAIQNRLAWIERSVTGGYVKYGQNDTLPNEIVEIVNNSGTATACAQRLMQFIKADGFKDLYTGQRYANKDQTFDQLLTEVVENKVYLNGVAFHLFFNNAGGISEIKAVPIPWIRIKDDDHFIVNPLMGEHGKSTGQDKTIRRFDPNEDVNARRARIIEETKKNKGKQKGELFYAFPKRIGRNYHLYPAPYYMAGLDDIIADGKASTLELTEVMQGWRSHVVISTSWMDDVNTIKDSEGNDTGVTELSKFKDGIMQSLGEDGSTVLLLMGKTPEEMPKVTVLDSDKIGASSTEATKRIGEKVCRHFVVPKILVGFSDSGQLGNVNEIKNMMDLFYISIINHQNFVTETFNTLKPLLSNNEMLDFTLSKLNPLTLIPDSVISMLTENEVRKLFELEIKEQNAVNTTLTNLTGRQMQGVQRIVRKFNKDDITYEQAASLLKSGFGFTDDDVDLWLVTKEEEENGDNNIN